MKTYKQLFAELKRPALIPFFVVGDPDPETSLQIIKAAIDSGADVLELGIQFSDPIADGPTIQKADIRAAKAGMDIQKALEIIRKIKDYKDIPIGLLMYYNLIYQYGPEKFFADAHKAGINSVLVADLSIDDADAITSPAKNAGLDTVFMITPNTETKRAKLIASKTTGFIYAVSLLGVTGGRDQLSGLVEDLIQKLKSLTDLPICVGFGISKPEHAAAIAKAGADGVIIGSALIKIIEQNLTQTDKIIDQVSSLIKGAKNAIEN